MTLDGRPGPARIDVVGVGEPMLLLHPSAGVSLVDAATLTVDVAGAELNVCATVARFGLAAALCTRLGTDPAGDRILRTMGTLGVSTELVRRDETRQTGLLLRELLADGVRRVHYYRATSAASRLSAADAAAVLDSRPRAVVVSGLTAALGDAPEECVRTLVDESGPADIALVVDANLRPQLGRLERVRGLLLEALPRIDLLILGIDEAEVLLGAHEPRDVLDRLAGAGVREAVLKAGADGAYLLDDAELLHVSSLATRVVDPVGAGDAFTGGYLAARLRGKHAAGAARVAARVAAGVVGTTGDLSGLPDGDEAPRLLDT